MNPGLNKKKIFSVGGGKGGVGKSIFSVALGCILAKAGHSVILVDLDLGAANLHTYLGIIKDTHSIAEFIERRVTSLEEILIETSSRNLKIISGAEFVPGIANPAHWMKLKIVRHIRSLPADYIILDLGAGVHFNILDFFGISDRGIVVTTPEPGSVMNAYSFIKAALFRKLQGVFKKHPEIGPLISSEIKKTEGENKFTIEWLSNQIIEIDPHMLPLIGEIEQEFCPALVANRMEDGVQHVLVRNLISLCKERLGVPVEHIGNLPDVREISEFLLDIPRFIGSQAGKSYFDSIEHIAGQLIKVTEKGDLKSDFNDEEVAEVIRFIDELDGQVFKDTNRDTWKLRMYFKPVDVVEFLMSRGVTHKTFYRN